MNAHVNKVVCGGEKFPIRGFYSPFNECPGVYGGKGKGLFVGYLENKNEKQEFGMFFVIYTYTIDKPGHNPILPYEVAGAIR